MLAAKLRAAYGRTRKTKRSGSSSLAESAEIGPAAVGREPLDE